MGEERIEARSVDAALPDEQEQEWLLARLGDLLEKRGATRFLEDPIVEPTPRFFPDLWTPDLEGARSLCERLLEHAGLGDLGVELLAFHGVPGGADEPGHAGVVGWFAGIEGDVCRFGIKISMLRDANDAAGILSHEVAHAYRARHALSVKDVDLEERLTDLTTVYLGLGLLFANVSDRTKVTRKTTQTYHETTIVPVKMGYLDPEMVAFLLAAQLVAQGASKEAVRRTLMFLDSNQQVSLRRAHAELASDRAGLLECLGLPASTPPGTALARRTRKWQGAEPWKDDFAFRGLPWGHTANRLVHARIGAGTMVGVVAGFGLAALAVRDAGPEGLALWPISVALGRVAGRRIRIDRCGGCGALLPLRAEECPRCARFIVAEVENLPLHLSRGENLEKRVTRIIGHQGPAHLLNAGLLATALFAPLILRLGFPVVLALIGAATFAGWFRGRLLRLDTCSDPDCRAILDPTLRQCPRCSGEIDGERATRL